MNTLYWVKEYILVFLVYGFTMFVYPEIVFRKYLRGRTLTMRVCFDSLVMPAAINTLVVVLGLCGWLNQWVIRVIFWGGLLASIIIPFISKNGNHTLQRFAALLTGGYGVKSFGVDVAKNTKRDVKKGIRKIDIRLVNHTVLYALLVICIVYGLIYFGANSFQTPSYGSGDTYLYGNWIYEMTKGVIFSAGIYPAGVHSFVYLINTCFGVSVYSVLVFLQPIHVGLFLIAIFLLCKEVFNWRYTGIIVLVLILTLRSGTVNSLFAFSRLQWGLAQEFAAPAAIMCPIFLLRYLKSIRQEGKGQKIIHDENLIVFALAILVTISTHFYCTVVGFFLCLAIMPVYIKEVFTKKQFERLLVTVLIATLVAVIPLAVAIPVLSARKDQEKIFQGSLTWGVKVIKGEIVDDCANEGMLTTPTPSVVKPDSDSSKASGIDLVVEIFRNYNSKNYGSIFDERGTEIYRTAVGISLGFVIICTVIVQIIKSGFRKKEKEVVGLPGMSPYYCLIIMTVNIMMMCEPSTFGLPVLLSAGRLAYYATILNLMAVMIPLDFLLDMLKNVLKDRLDWIVALASSVVALVLVIVSGNFHGCLYYQLTRYNSAVDTTVNIIKENEKNTYTIVSNTDETWQVSGKGFHEEMLQFIISADDKSYKLTTEKVYIFLEKNVLHYAQMHFPTLPEWIASADRSMAVYPDTTMISLGDAVINYDPVKYHGVKIANDTERYDTSRRLIYAYEMMKWIETFQTYYPRTLKVYYEDDDFICYYFEQNANAPYELALQDKDDAE